MRTVITMMALAAACAGCGSSAAVDEGTVTAPPASTPVVQPGGGSSGGTSGGEPPAASMQLQAWFVRDRLIWPVQVTVERTQAVGSAAMQALLSGPTAAQRQAGLSSGVPAGTRLLGLNVKGGTATVDLSSEYDAAGDARSVTARLAQVVYTLTQFPTVKRVAFHLDGEPVTAFPSTGAVLSRPQTRQDYAAVVPAIAVELPEAHAVLGSPIVVSGVANVFEANVGIEVLDAAGRTIGRTVTTATCGTGCVGSFRATVSYSVDHRQQGTLLVHDDDAAGTGTYPHEVRIPVTLLP